MVLFSTDSFSQEVLAAALAAAAWGLVCGIFERFLLAPRRRLSAIGPAYFPAMTLALLGGYCFVASQGGIGLFFALLMAGVFFVVGAAPALAAFHLSRRIFRTHFSDKANS